MAFIFPPQENRLSRRQSSTWLKTSRLRLHQSDTLWATEKKTYPATWVLYQHSGGGGRHLIIMRGNFLAERAATSYLKYTVAQITYVLRTLALHFLTHTIDFSARVTHAGIFKRPGYLLLIIPKRDRPTHPTSQRNKDETKLERGNCTKAPFGQTVVTFTSFGLKI